MWNSLCTFVLMKLRNWQTDRDEQKGAKSEGNDVDQELSGANVTIEFMFWKHGIAITFRFIKNTSEINTRKSHVSLCVWMCVQMVNTKYRSVNALCLPSRAFAVCVCVLCVCCDAYSFISIRIICENGTECNGIDRISSRNMALGVGMHVCSQCSLLVVVVGYHAFGMQKVKQTQITYIKLHAPDTHTHNEQEGAKQCKVKKTDSKIDTTMSCDSSTSVTQCISNICCVKCYGAMLVCRLIENSKIELRLHEWYGRLVEAHEKPAECNACYMPKKVIVARLVCYAHTHGLMGWGCCCCTRSQPSHIFKLYCIFSADTVHTLHF